MTRINFMNTEIDNLTMNETLIEIDKLIRLNECAYVVTPNVDHIVQLERDEELKRVYENASLILADGKPLIWISKFYKTPIKEKINPPEENKENEKNKTLSKKEKSVNRHLMKTCILVKNLSKEDIRNAKANRQNEIDIDEKQKE